MSTEILKQAHWFSMPEFWTQAAKLVRPQGTVALWTCSSLYCRKYSLHAILLRIVHLQSLAGRLADRQAKTLPLATQQPSKKRSSI